MKDLPASVKCLIPFATWFEKHPKVMNVILWAEAIALLYVIFTYDFTTRI